MRKIRNTTVLAAFAGLALLVSTTPALACGGCGCTTSKKAEKKQGNIVETAASAGTFETLLTAAKAAGLAETLAEKGPFTVFAPTDKAFAKLPDGTVESLLKDTDKLKQILLYHVVEGKVKAKQAMKADEVATLQGQKLKLEVKGKTLMINNAKVTAADVMASNGVIHVIDTVLLPPSKPMASAAE